MSVFSFLFSLLFSTKVVPKKLGTVFWFGTAVNTALLPCFNPKIVEFGGGEEGDWMRVCAAKWPFDDVMQRPLQSSGRTLELEYDVEFQQVSALVVIHHSSVVESEFFWEKISPLLLFLASFFVKRSRQSVEEYCFGEFFCQNISPWFEKLALDFFFFGLEFFFWGREKSADDNHHHSLGTVLCAQVFFPPHRAFGNVPSGPLLDTAIFSKQVPSSAGI